MTTEFQRHKYQDAFVALAHQFRTVGFFGGLQGGKSIAGADALGDLLYHKDPAKQANLPEQTRGALNPEVWILSKSFALADQAWSYFKWRCGEAVYTADECRKLGLERGEQRVYWLKPLNRADGRPIKLKVRTAHDPEQLRATGVLLVAWCDEVAHWPELAWKNLQGRGIVTPTRYLITTTPNGKTWSYRSVWDPAIKFDARYNFETEETEVWATSSGNPSIACVRSRSIDNPWADQDYLTQLRKNLGVKYAEQELDALFVEDTGIVYSFDRNIHMIHTKGPYDKVVGGIDPGYGDPYAILVMGKKGGKWFVLDEFEKTHTTSDDVVPILRDMGEKWGVSAWYVDKRRPSDYILLKKAGIPAYPNIEIFGENQKRTVMPMIRYCQGLLKGGRLWFSKSLEKIAVSLEKYHFPERDEKNPGENPVKWMDHLPDAMRYAICSVDPYVHVEGRQYTRNVRGKYKSQRQSTGPRDPIRIPSAKESLAAQDKAMDGKMKRPWNTQVR